MKIYFIFIGKADIQRGGETKICLMVHSPSGLNSRSCADPKPGVSSFFQVSHVGAGAQGFGLSSTAFPGHKQGAGWEVGLPGHKLAPIWDTGMFKVRTLAARPPHQALFLIFIGKTNIQRGKSCIC